ncbi:GNAT family N-acetyltransferase [Geodermatophilus sp. TF02-6]|uniref:GNAT family N-acetyltransferase n=1 Tax=Geodermatophilus sp. TF02-6 TaxID=2250575 RepID=UPI0011BFB0E2|nr:GNAT family N-acetyltransferase [Geodermatophilus sp. TF02-6]
MGAVLPEWRGLHRRLGGWSPFTDPDYQMVWCDRFVDDGDERILAVRHADTRELVAVVPLFLATVGGRGMRGRVLALFGAFREPLLLELPELLVQPEHARAALVTVVAWLAEHREWDWVELTLGEEQPWPVSRWLADAGLDPAILVHKSVLPSVVLDLPDTGDLPPLGRNLRESLRRSRNRTKGPAGEWRVDEVGPEHPCWDEAVADLRRLHRARAGMTGVIAHPDVFRGTSQGEFLAALAGTPAATLPRVHRLLRDDVAVAALLVFHSVTRTWLSVSGVSPDAWHVGGVTRLQWEAVQDAVRRRQTSVVFSTGVDAAKQRWSPTVRVSHSFAVVNPRRGSRLTFTLYWLARSLRHLRRHTVHHPHRERAEPATP